jgi:hypothetical protein
MRLCIITATLNENVLIGQHIDYLNELRSSHKIFYIIADGGSVDGTVDSIKLNITSDCLLLKNSGKIYESWNFSLENLPPQITHVAFLGVGDRLRLNYLQEILYSNNSDKIDIHTSGLEIGSKKYPLIKADLIIKAISSANVACMPVHHSGTIFSVRLFKIIGKFNPIYMIASDLDWMLRLKLVSDISVYSFAGYGVSMRQYGISSGGLKSFAIIREELKISLYNRRFPCFKRILYLLYSYFNRDFPLGIFKTTKCEK